ncbi:MAG: GGDEF domain-containing protein [Burkholderiaceae bacterium]|nr:GGDEF domain-containing protein [Burkholderiaceae bacterium]
MHSPTLIIFAAVLSALVTLVLYAVWHFNRHIPGLRWWVCSFLCTTVFCASLLARADEFEWASVVISQLAVAVAGYLCLLGSRAYVGRPAASHIYAGIGLVALVAASLYFTLVDPKPGARFVLIGLFSGVCFVLSARTLRGVGTQQTPVRYLVAALLGLHGLFILLRPIAFKVMVPQGDAGLASTLSSLVVLEGTVAMVLMGFGVVMLTNEFITNELRHLAEVDPLTAVFNRRAVLSLLDKSISNAQRSQVPLPVLVLDLDHFKLINDTYGHQGGDEALRHFVRIAQQCLRKEDVIGRIGGEEFAVFLPNADGEGALALAQRLRGLLAATPLLTASARPVTMTVSIGVTLSESGDTPEIALQRADAAMYLAKQRGRNRVEMLPFAAA